MRNSFTFLLLLINSLIFTLPAFGQLPCENGRYLNPIFPNITTTSGIEYGENIQPTILDPNGTQTLRLDFYEPEGDTAARRPLIIWAFGGAFVIGLRASPDIVELSQRFSRLGYTNASIDYRLTPELAFNASPELGVTAVQKAVHDMRAAIRFFYKDAQTDDLYRIDTNRIYIGGVSAGALTALHTGYLNKLDEIPSILDTTGLGGLEGLSGNPGYSSDIAGVINLSGALLDTTWIEAGDIPLVSLHGTADDVVPFDNSPITLFGLGFEVHGSSTIHPRLDNLGIDNFFYAFEGAGHTPFILGDNTDAYMDTTFEVVRNFLYEQVCGMAVSVEDELESSLPFEAYPNPTYGNLTLLMPEEVRGQTIYSLMSLEGKEVKRGRFSGNQHTIYRESLPAGMYILKVTAENHRQSIKRVVFR